MYAQRVEHSLDSLIVFDVCLSVLHVGRYSSLTVGTVVDGDKYGVILLVMSLDPPGFNDNFESVGLPLTQTVRTNIIRRCYTLAMDHNVLSRVWEVHNTPKQSTSAPSSSRLLPRASRRVTRLYLLVVCCGPCSGEESPQESLRVVGSDDANKPVNADARSYVKEPSRTTRYHRGMSIKRKRIGCIWSCLHEKTTKISVLLWTRVSTR